MGRARLRNRLASSCERMTRRMGCFSGLLWRSRMLRASSMAHRICVTLAWISSSPACAQDRTVTACPAHVFCTKKIVYCNLHHNQTRNTIQKDFAAVHKSAHTEVGPTTAPSTSTQQWLPAAHSAKGKAGAGAHLRGLSFWEVAPVHGLRRAGRQSTAQVLVHHFAEERREGRHSL